ncbi:ABC transporter substrate-binding protein [Rahnella sp. PCH160]|uniref:ABC transporter substrate-binding protein n=1 Tax=Rahnella sp. PCH160 TaxID=3447928 RepID=UPI0039FCC12D
MLRHSALSLLLTVAVLGSAHAADNTEMASTPETVKVVTFQGGWNLPVWVAQEKGFFSKRGLHVEMDYTPNSDQLIKNLLEGKYNIAVAGIDNVMAYQEGQGAIPVKHPDMFAFYGVDNGLLSLVAKPEIKNVSELKGKKISVDALSTGYAFVIRNYLEQNGLTDRDVQYSSVGSTGDRYKALLAGSTDATLLRTPLDLQAKDKGFKVLATGSELGDYQGTVGVTTRSWASNHNDTLVSYVRGYMDALNWLYESRNRKEAEAILLKNAPGMTHELVGKALNELLDNGLQRDAAINPAGVRNVLMLRSRLARPEKRLTEEKKYYDTRYWKQALKLNALSSSPRSGN